MPLGSAYALAARRSGAAALAASSGQAGPRPAACGLAPAGARNLYRRAHWRRKRRLSRALRAAGRGERRLRAGYAGRATGRQGQGKRRAGGSAAPAAALPAGSPASEKKLRRVSRLLAVHPPAFYFFLVVCLCLLLRVVYRQMVVCGGLSAVAGGFLGGLCPDLLGRSGPPKRRQMPLVLHWRHLLQGAFGLWGPCLGGWPLSAAGSARKKNPSPVISNPERDFFASPMQAQRARRRSAWLMKAKV